MLSVLHAVDWDQGRCTSPDQMAVGEVYTGAVRQYTISGVHHVVAAVGVLAAAGRRIAGAPRLRRTGTWTRRDKR
eukprot:2790474-Prymnesium_polylepis.1